MKGISFTQLFFAQKERAEREADELEAEKTIASSGPGFYSAIERKYGKKVPELTHEELNEIRALQGWEPNQGGCR